jgi:diguanylate cyclase (GGDEF)-like protein/PAS domain S-box-containing protein
MTKKIVSILIGLCLLFTAQAMAQPVTQTRVAVDSQIILGALLLGLVFALFIKLMSYSRRLRELRARAEEGDRRLHQFSEQLPGVLYQFRMLPDGSSHYPYASEGALKMFGVSPEALMDSPQNLLDRLHPDDVEPYQARIRRSAETLQGWAGDYRVILPDGSIHWREGTASPQRLADGSILWHGFAADIDARKAAESQSELLIAALEASANAIAITDLSGSIEWVNPAFCELTGYTRVELVGGNPRLLKSGMHDAAFYEEMWKSLKSGRSWRGEIVNRRKDGRLIDEELIIAPVRDAKGSTHHYIAIKQNISERKRMEDELRLQAATDALTGMANRREFFSRAESELARIKRGKAGMAAIIMVDIDHFKRVNDTYGHAVGDVVLRHLADTVTGSLRRSDFSGRIGGEEFALMLPETSVEQGVQFAERLRVELEQSKVTTEAGDISYTASFGLALMSAEDASLDVALARADEALYRAKGAGRNRVEVTV